MKKNFFLALMCIAAVTWAADDFSRHQIKINKKFTLDAQESLLVSSQPFFLIDQPAKVELKNIYCVRSGNLQQEEKGGVLALLNGAFIKVSDSVFDGNGSHQWSTYGGAIFVRDNSEIEIHNCVFNSNRAQHGAALSVVGNNAKVHLTDTSFLSNQAKSPAPGNFGGAIFLQGNPVNFSFVADKGKTIIISGNSAYSGGFIHTHNAGIKLLFDIKKDAKLIVGSLADIEKDSINLVAGAQMVKRGAGTFCLNSTITQHFSTSESLPYDIIIEDGTFIFGAPQQLSKKLLVSGGQITFFVRCRFQMLTIKPDHNKTAMVKQIENLNDTRCVISGKNDIDVFVDKQKNIMLKANNQTHRLDNEQQFVVIDGLLIKREEQMGNLILSVSHFTKQ